MKAICISACEVDGFGIVTPGEEIELADGYAKDERIRLHFVIDQKTVKDPNAKIPDFDADKDACRERFKKSLYNETDWWKAVNKLMDEGAAIPDEILDRNDATLTDEERVERLAAIWTDSYGWSFPTDPQGAADRGEREKGEPQTRGERRKSAKAEPESLFDSGK